MSKFFSDNIKAFLCLFTLIVILCMTSNVAATDTAPTDLTGMTTIFCNVINEITGTVGKLISVLILISMAIGLFLGKITWGLAIAVMVGMGMLFGATGLVDMISSGTSASGTSAQTLCATS